MQRLLLAGPKFSCVLIQQLGYGPELVPLLLPLLLLLGLE